MLALPYYTTITDDYIRSRPSQNLHSPTDCIMPHRPALALWVVKTGFTGCVVRILFRSSFANLSMSSDVAKSKDTVAIQSNQNPTQSLPKNLPLTKCFATSHNNVAIVACWRAGAGFFVCVACILTASSRLFYLCSILNEGHKRLRHSFRLLKMHAARLIQTITDSCSNHYKLTQDDADSCGFSRSLVKSMWPPRHCLIEHSDFLVGVPHRFHNF